MFDSIPHQLDDTSEATAPDYIGTATYSPDDNKLRLYPFARLDTDIYGKVKAAGFKWAPRQQLFVAPMWTPGRADLLTALCGEIGDEDSSLVERAEERAERFEGYQERRAADAQRERDNVARIADGIPLGQPILVGHHSERRARKDKERIDSGMRRAVKMWETSKYWEARAAGALAHAKYKELPGVRHRRIKGIESDKRKYERAKATSEMFINLWSADGLTTDQAVAIANDGRCTVSRCFPLAEFPRNPPASQYEGSMSLWSALTDGVITAEQAREIAVRVHTRSVARYDRWLTHFDLRLGYERAMLNEQLGVNGAEANGMAARFDFKPGGRVLVGSEWLAILRVNKSNGTVNSLTTSPPSRVTWSSHWNVGVEEVKDYKAPTEEDSAKAAKATKLAPLVNYPGDGFIVMTSEEWKKKPADYRIIRKAKATAEHGAYRYRVAWVPGGSYKQAQVYISDEKTKERPAADQAAAPVTFDRQRELPSDYTAPRPRSDESADDAQFSAMRNAIKKGGAAVVVTPQLFPTPPDLGRRMVKLAGGVAGRRVLEPEAGTGNLIRAAWNDATGADNCRVVAIETSSALVQGLRDMQRLQLYANDSNFRIVCADFLEIDGPDALAGDVPEPSPLGLFDVILMNPPFANAADVRHIKHATKFLKPGGTLVAICANGPRQRDSLMPMATHWEDLPAGTFKESGTNVATALLVINSKAPDNPRHQQQGD